MAKKQTEPINDIIKSNSTFTRREMLGMTGMAGLAALTGIVPGAVAQTAQKRPRIACLVSYWGAPRSHADWIITKLLDGYWWQGAHTPPRVDVVSVYINQLETSILGQKICKAKNIPIYKTVGEAVTLGGKELAVDGVVIVAEHGEYPINLKGQWMLPRWENGRYSAIGRRIETPFMNMKYRSTRGAQFSTGKLPPNTPYIRGFES